MQNYKKYKKLVIGCGIKKEKDAWNIDIIRKVKPNEVVNLNKKLPYQSNWFQEIIADYVLTQMTDRKDFLRLMNELWRILHKDGVLKIKVGNAQYPVVWNDPMDSRRFTEETFSYFDYSHYRYKAFNYGFLPWRILQIKKINGGTSKKKDRLFIEMSPKK